MFGFRSSVGALVAKFDKLEDQLITEAQLLQQDAAALDVEAEEIEAELEATEALATSKRVEASRALRIASRVAGLIS